MTQTELLADNLKRNTDMVRMTISDFSDADMLVRPTPTANHALWQLGHLAGAAAHFAQMAGAAVDLSEAMKIGEKCGKETSSVDDPAKFGAKDQWLAALEQATVKLCEWVKSLPEAELARKTTGPMADFAPTVGHVILMIPSHVQMHVGQFQVIRRKLGKPILF